MSVQELTATALYNYKSSDVDELSMRKGDVLSVLEAYDDGWWLMKRGDSIGLIPSNYLLTGSQPSVETKEQEHPGIRRSNFDKNKTLF